MRTVWDSISKFGFELGAARADVVSADTLEPRQLGVLVVGRWDGNRLCQLPIDDPDEWDDDADADDDDDDVDFDSDLDDDDDDDEFDDDEA